MSGAPSTVLRELCPERTGSLDPPQDPSPSQRSGSSGWMKGSAGLPDLTSALGGDRQADADPAGPLQERAESLSTPFACSLPAAPPPYTHLLLEKPQRRYHFEPRTWAGEMRPLVTAGQVAAHRRAGMGGGSAEMGTTGPRRLHAPPRQAASSSPCTTIHSLPDGFLDSSSAHSSPIPGPQGGAPGAPTWLAPAPGRHQLPAHFRTLRQRKVEGPGPGRGRGGKTEAI